MQECPRCTSQKSIKSGITKGRQRYKCKDCSYHYSVVQKSDTSTDSQRKLALTLYLEVSVNSSHLDARPHLL